MVDRNESLTLTRRDVVRDEIDGAIRLVLAENYAGAHVLASAALQVLTDVAAHDAKETFNIAIHELAKPERRGELKALLNAAYNFMKHADRDPEKEFAGYNVGYTEAVLAVATWDFQKVYGHVSTLMALYRGWYTVREPDLILWPNHELARELAAKINYARLVHDYDADPRYRLRIDEMVARAAYAGLSSGS